MTEMKWMQVLSRSGAELDLVRSWAGQSVKKRDDCMAERGVLP